jgi:hypothetical protein
VDEEICLKREFKLKLVQFSPVGGRVEKNEFWKDVIFTKRMKFKI